MEGGEAAPGRDLEHRARAGCAACPCRAVEVAITGLDQAGFRIGAIVSSREVIEGGERTRSRDLKHRAIVVCASRGSRSVEVAIASLDQAGFRIGAIVSSREVIEYGERTRSRDLKHRARAGCAARGSRAVEVAIAGLDQAG